MGDRRNVGENSCNFGDGTDQRDQSLMYMTMMMMMMMTMMMIKGGICVERLSTVPVISKNHDESQIIGLGQT